jgi:lysophospholipase L1-like esterase
MARDASSSATPRPRAPLPAAAVLGALAAGGVVAGRTAATIRRMRQAAAGADALVHELELDGRGPTTRVTVLGDSAAAGHGIGSADDALPRLLGRALAADGQAVSVRCLAEDGATTEEVADRQVPRFAPVEEGDGCDVVVIGVGVNDALRRHPVSLVRHDTRRLLEAVTRACPCGTTVLVTCPDLGVAPGLPAPVRGAVGWRCRSVAAAQQEVADELGVPAVALDRELLRPEHFGADGFHPGPVGLEQLARLVVDRL